MASNCQWVCVKKVLLYNYYILQLFQGIVLHYIHSQGFIQQQTITPMGFAIVLTQYITQSCMFVYPIMRKWVCDCSYSVGVELFHIRDHTICRWTSWITAIAVCKVVKSFFGLFLSKSRNTGRKEERDKLNAIPKSLPFCLTKLQPSCLPGYFTFITWVNACDYFGHLTFDISSKNISHSSLNPTL